MSKNNIFLALFYSVLCSLALCGPQVVEASRPSISVKRVYEESRGVFFSATLKDSFTKEIRELMTSGAALPFRFHILLKMKRGGWADKTVGKITLTKSVKYDFLKKEYKASEMIKRKGRIFKKSPEEKSRHFVEKNIGSLEETEKWMSDLNGIFLLNLNKMKPSKEYYIQVRVDLLTIDLWVPFNYIFFFLSFWDVDTKWATSAPFTANTLLPSGEGGN
ncbi:MAG: DUF4390 domain-containing protein [Nitrospinota bacterium]